MSPPGKRFVKAGLILAVGIVIIGAGVVLVRNLSTPSHEFNDPPIVLHDIAWDVNPMHGYTIYISEDGEYVPYLVLTTDYNGDGNVLLLRKYLLDEMMVFNYLQNEVPEGLTSGVNFRPSYYRTSKIDSFLNGEFLERLSAIEDIIVNSNIVITHIYSIGRGGSKLQAIERKIFLLSHMEVTGISRGVILAEGEPLQFFVGIRNHNLRTRLRIATTADGEPHNWWLRTSVNSNVLVAGVIDFRGGAGGTAVRDPLGSPEFGVRPAFCLPRDTPIKEMEIDGRIVFVLDLE